MKRTILLAGISTIALARALSFRPTAGLFEGPKGALRVVSPFHAPVVAPGRA